MRKHTWLRVLLTIILVALLLAIAGSIFLVGTGRAAKMLESRGITFLSKKEAPQTDAGSAETAAPAADAAVENAVPAPDAGTGAEAAGTPADAAVTDPAAAPADAAAANPAGTPVDATAVPPADAAGTETTTAEGETAAADAAAVPAVTRMIGDKPVSSSLTFTASESTVTPAENELTSANCFLVNLNDDSIVVQNKADEKISPASMTKILALLIAAEHLDPAAPVEMTDEMIRYCASNGLSAAGFEAGKTYSAGDLMYGAILPSGGEAVAGLAIACAGSLDEFTTMMNNKLEELGLSETAHFTNCAGLYDPDHYCTLSDMAAILKAALMNETARKVLSTKVYIMPASEEGKEDLVLSNWFLRRIEDKDAGGEVIAAKTGFVNESGNCAASYLVSPTGVPYICVTAHSSSEWNCIYDHVALYKKYAV